MCQSGRGREVGRIGRKAEQEEKFPRRYEAFEVTMRALRPVLELDSPYYSTPASCEYVNDDHLGACVESLVPMCTSPRPHP